MYGRKEFSEKGLTVSKLAVHTHTGLKGLRWTITLSHYHTIRHTHAQIHTLKEEFGEKG
jgi:hypothetical protein